MTSPVSPLSDETLQAFDRGLLSPDEIDAVTRWLEAHPEAEERLRRLADGAPVAAVEALRKPCALADELAGLSDLTSSVVNRVLAGDAEPMVDRELSGDTVPKQIRDYQLLRPLGRGGMGSVYVARHTRLQRDVALKLLLGHVSADPGYRARFEREMAVVGQLDHPHLIRAHDAGAEGSHLFLVMELLDGCDLARVVATRGPLSLPDACEVVRQAALGLHHAHEHGLVHRDIKPANLFLTRTGAVKVIDLGLARMTTGPAASEGVSTVHTVMGTPECMAPEQWENSAVDRRADLYALGCALFMLLTRDPPFQPADPNSWVAWMDAHRWQPVPNLHERLAEAPSALAELVTSLLAKKPERRPATAQDVAERLASFTAGHDLAGLCTGMQGRPTDIRRPALPTQHRPRASRRVLAPLVLVLCLAAIGWLLPQLFRPEATFNRALPTLVAPFTAEQAAEGQQLYARDQGIPMEFINSLGMKLVLIPPGTFRMGTSAAELEWLLHDKNIHEWWGKTFIPDEAPQHVVTLSQPFYLGTSEVTVADFRDFVNATGYRTEPETDRKGGRVSGPDKLQYDVQWNWRTPGHPQTNNHPVVQITWNDAMAFCRWLSDGEGRSYRLPTEAEWEWACRAGSETAYFFGNDPSRLSKYCVVSEEEGGRLFLPAGERLPNPWGLFDMHGNVMEWCADWFGPDYYANSPQFDPPGPAKGKDRMIRSGYRFSQIVRSAYRYHDKPTAREQFIGFRVKCAAPPK
jgi:formylglycine-generating enzyme required for sulfatase activity